MRVCTVHISFLKKIYTWVYREKNDCVATKVLVTMFPGGGGYDDFVGMKEYCQNS